MTSRLTDPRRNARTGPLPRIAAATATRCAASCTLAARRTDRRAALTLARFMALAWRA